MTKQVIDTTTPQPNGKQGEPIRAAFGKTQSNFDELYARTGGNASLPSGTRALLTSDKQANPTDTTAGKLLTVGSFGLGGSEVKVMDLGATLDSLRGQGTGWYRMQSAGGNQPPDAPFFNSNCLVFHVEMSASVFYQEIYYPTRRVFRRFATTWGAWIEMANAEGNAAQRFKAAPSAASDDVAVRSQVPWLGQTEQQISGRVQGQIYVNPHGKKIELCVTAQATGATAHMIIEVNGTVRGFTSPSAWNSYSQVISLTIPIPKDANYALRGLGLTSISWLETY